MNPNNTQLFRKQGQSQVVDAQGNLVPFSGNLDTLPVYNQQNNVITPDALSPKTKIDLSGTVQPTTAPSVESDMAFFTDLQNKRTMQEQQLAEQKKAGTSEIDRLLGEIAGKPAEQLTLEQGLVNPIDKQVAEQSGLARTQLAEYNALKAERDQLISDLEVGTRSKGTADVRASVLFGQQGAIERQYLARLNTKASEIALTQANVLALQGQAEAAQKQVDRAINLKYSVLENELAVRQNQLDRIKEDLTAEEKKRWEAQQYALNKEEKRLAEAKSEEKSIKELALKVGGFGADASTIQKVMNAKDFNEALTAAGKYLQNPKDSLDMQLTKAQIAKTWADAKNVDKITGTLTEAQLKQIDMSPQGKKLVSLSGLYQKSQTYKNLLDTYGFRAVGSEKAKLDQAYADLKIAYKEAANLGALTGPDVLLLEEAIKPASGAVNYLNYRISGGKKGVSGAIEGALSKARKEALQNYKQLTARKPEYRGSEYVTSLIAPFAEDYSKVQLDNLSAGEIIQTPDGILLEALGNRQFSPL